MHTDKNLQFITSRILDTEVALFHCLTNSILKIPNTVINTLDVDSDGNVWFFVARPQQLISQFDQAFPVRLKYYKKGKNYTFDVFGTAQMLTDANDISDELKLSAEEISNALCTQLLIKVKINKVEFHELAFYKTSYFKQFKAMLYSWFNWTQREGREYNFNTPAPVRYGF